MTLKYTYSTLITFSVPVYSHNFMLRCVPYDVPFQRVVESMTSIIPHCVVTESVDVFGNKLHTGYVADSHDAFMFESTGIIDVERHVTKENLIPIFKYQSDLTGLSAEMLAALGHLGEVSGDVDTWVMRLSDYIYGIMEYKPGTTNVTTTAVEAFAQRSGVCQDYAHIAIAMCREAGVAARYVNGFMLGEGATHAWVEYYDNGVWKAFDPTNNRMVDDTYIKIANGRDFNDCSINRGRFSGVAQQNVKVSLSVRKV